MRACLHLHATAAGMNLRSPASRRCSSFKTLAMTDRRTLDRSLQTFPPESHTDLIRRPGGMISVPKRIMSPPAASGSEKRLTKLLLNVTLERSLGPVHLVMSSECSVRELIKSALDTYGREQRRPLLTETDPRRFELHYSPFSFESLKADEKLINLGSRNFFLCSSRPDSRTCRPEEPMNGTADTAALLPNMMDFLL